MSQPLDSLLNVIAPAAQHCRSLRCKEMFIDTGREFKMEDSGSGIYWCGHTQTCLGPDGDVADTEHCKSGRGCYEAL
ncbi:MAG TPA: hypothetical protein VG204_19755 [Terriglobia bacterium]|nr:hypothetical protein [Terriglobia bacterium]